MLGDDAIISSDFGGNPPCEKMKEVARICFKHWVRQSNVLFIIGGKSNNTDILETFRAMADALRGHFARTAPHPCTSSLVVAVQILCVAWVLCGTRWIRLACLICSSDSIPI
ncbi:hypothetical protein AWB75_06660 [Caballeronia catudaia]|uniref:Uncharacterized protein n=1 Tax=Caballeronia catudaia TaxID=1777136 RepID=A0A158DFG7_9BURK|nr:hypothetical protein AWB75_06660 [Caballeronia catudaia]